MNYGRRLLIGYVTMTLISVLFGCKSSEGITVGSESSDKTSTEKNKEDSSDASDDASLAACSGNYTTGKTYENLAVSNGNGHLKMIFTEDCKVSIPHCGQYFYLPSNLNLQKDQVIHFATSIDIQGLDQYSSCLHTGIKACQISLVSFGSDSMFLLDCAADGQYGATKQ